MAGLLTVFHTLLGQLPRILHPRENLAAQLSLAALNADLRCFSDGASTMVATVTGSYTGTLVFEGTNDGWATVDTIPVKPLRGGGKIVLGLTSGQVGRFKGAIGDFSEVRARLTAWSAGTSSVRLVCDNGLSGDLGVIVQADQEYLEVVGTAGSAVTLTLPAPGPGLFHYVSRLQVQRAVSAGPLTPAASPLIVSTSNLVGSRTLRLPANADPTGTIAEQIVAGSKPIRAVNANTVTTVICPATTGVQWIVNAAWTNLQES
jgi:hypothetical protein